jgi:hypothetical protein
VEVSQVRKRLKTAIDASRERAQHRRERAAAAQRTFETFLEAVATPVTRQLANALKAEGYAFTVSTPGSALRLASDRGREDFIEVALDTSGDQPEVVARISHQRGSRTIDEETPVKPGAGPEEIGEDDVLDFFIGALEPWLER